MKPYLLSYIRTDLPKQLQRRFYKLVYVEESLREEHYAKETLEKYLKEKRPKGKFKIQSETIL